MPHERQIDSGMPSGIARVNIGKVFPGRGVSPTSPPPPAKPTEAETPWRSRWYVSYLNSADGNAYRRYDPIPLSEAIRQGLLDEDGTPIEVEDVMADPDLVKVVTDHPVTVEDPFRSGWVLNKGDCSQCMGTGRRSPKLKNHKPDCRCPGCSPCVSCGGSGRL